AEGLRRRYRRPAGAGPRPAAAVPRDALGPRSAADLLASAAADLDAARLGLFGPRDAQGQDAGVVRRVDALGVQGVAEEELAGERAGGTLCHEGLRVLGGRGAALGPHVQDIALDVQLDRLGVDAGEVEVDEELVTRPVRV